VSWRAPERLHVAVDGGELAVARWGSGPRPVVALHGITANHASFGEVADALVGSDEETRGTGFTLYAPDLRGRGGSAMLPGPYGCGRHADDVVAALDGLHLDGAILVGHSMGAYVAALVAARHPHRVRAVVLVDGGLPLELDLPDGTSDDEAIRAVIGPALARLETDYPDVAAHEATFRQHPALTGRWTDTLTAFAEADRVRDGARWRSPVQRGAVVADGAGPLRDAEVRGAVARLTVPTRLLHAPRGLLDEPGGLCPADAVAAVTAANRQVRAELVEDVNHYTIVFDPRGAGRVADAVRAVAGNDPSPTV
jgi:pimeloyl-ACP methyl ester carboxylesterase